MTDKYRIALKSIRSITTKINESLPDLEVTGTRSIESTPNHGSEDSKQLPTLQGHVSAFDRRMQSAPTLVTPKGSVSLEKSKRQDETLLLLPRNTRGTDLIFDKRWRRLASVYYLPGDIAIGYMCIHQQTPGQGQTSSPISNVVLNQITDDARKLVRTFDTQLLLSVGSLSGFDRETENHVASGLSNDESLKICVVTLGRESGFVCDYSDTSITWGVQYFIPESSGEILEKVKQEIRGWISTPDDSASRVEISNVLDYPLNYVDLAFIDLISNGEYEILVHPKDGPTLKKRNQA